MTQRRIHKMDELLRQRIEIQGVVQGVGFRPYIYKLALQCSLSGFVRNQGSHVLIEAQGSQKALGLFLGALHRSSSQVSRLRSMAVSSQEPRCGESGFSIAESQFCTHIRSTPAPDLAICQECLLELLDNKNRRNCDPFITCTQCGPRHTIVRALPYDRQNTSMALFTMCEACCDEYRDAEDRRFHSQSLSCPHCGPRLRLLDCDGVAASGNVTQMIHDAALFLKRGLILAVKGLGGFHFVCDATNEHSVAMLRQRKRRYDKPFGLMEISTERLQEYCEISQSEKELLEGPQRPIVLLKQRSSSSISTLVAPRSPYLGVMLPSTSLQYLLLQKSQRPLVATSANLSHEPMVYKNDVIFQKAKGIADYFLLHNRPIDRRSDDSVMSVAAGQALFVRRSRGYVPEPIATRFTFREPILAVGGHLKSVFAIGRENSAILSHHLGQLHSLESCSAFQEAVADYERLFQIQPLVIAHDLHPDYHSTRYAQKRAQTEPMALHGIQHHHAHMASCMVENGLDETVIAVIFDGAGYGLDGAIWGGEFLLGDYHDVQRAAHFRYLRLPGGEAAIHEPWRMAVAALMDAGHSPWAFDFLGQKRQQESILSRMIETGLNSPYTSSVGRLFDAVSALLGLRTVASYDGQAAMELEWMAMNETAMSLTPYPFQIDANETGYVIDMRDTISAIVDDLRKACMHSSIALKFHETIVDVIVQTCILLREEHNLRKVVLSGGVFLNRILLEKSVSRLRAEGFDVYTQTRVPPNDGGLCLGQLAVAHASLRQTRESPCA